MSQVLILTNQAVHEQMLNFLNNIPCVVTLPYTHSVSNLWLLKFIYKGLPNLSLLMHV